MSLQQRIGQWQRETFGSGQTNSAMMHHLAKEVSEFFSSCGTDGFKEEAADVAILLMGIAERNGIGKFQRRASSAVICPSL